MDGHRIFAHAEALHVIQVAERIIRETRSNELDDINGDVPHYAQTPSTVEWTTIRLI